MEHGRLLMHEAGKGLDTSHLKKLIANLEEAAGSGTEVFRTAWQAAWRNSGPEGDVRKLTVERVELNKHLERLKRLAADTDEAEKEQQDRQPDDIGETRKDPPPQEPGPDQAYDDDFPGDRK